MGQLPAGIFITGTDTDVGKTYVAALIARALAASGLRVGVYKPVASGCRTVDGELIADDALALWNAAGQPGTLDEVCPQRFSAPLAPPLAARAQGAKVDTQLLLDGIIPWRKRSDVLLVEGAGGLLSPLSDDLLVADLAAQLGLPLLVVAANRIGVVNQVLMTILAARHQRAALDVLGVVLNEIVERSDDPSVATNHGELQRHTDVPIIADLRYGDLEFPPAAMAELHRRQCEFASGSAPNRSPT